MNISDITIIIPIYNLSSSRFNNFCFLVKEVNKLGCAVIVSEQTSTTTSTIEEYLVGFENINHITINNNSDKINKSKLMNEAARSSFTEFLWMVDCDFYTNFSNVINEADSAHDFIRPFDSVLLLNKEETYKLHATHTIELTDTKEREVNSQDGKFSFIIRATDFQRVGGMNEDFVGWGFQDLDFVENRLKDSVSYSNVIETGYHMNHPPASRADVNINRQLYVNYKTSESKELVSNKLKEYYGKQLLRSKKSIYTNKDLKKQQSAVKTPPRVIKAKPIPVWKSPEFGVVYSRHPDIYYPGTDIITVRDTSSFSLKNVNGSYSKVKQSKHFLYYYFEYICHIYELLEMDSVVLFANDMYCKGGEKQKELKEIFKKVISEKVPDRDSIGFTSLYSESQRLAKKRYSSRGCFLVNSNNILKHEFEYYYSIFEKMSDWDTSVYQTKVSELREIFS
jgi:hypothetical protein